MSFYIIMNKERTFNELTEEEKKEFMELNNKLNTTSGEERMMNLTQLLTFVDQKLNRSLLNSILEREMKLGNVVFIGM